MNDDKFASIRMDDEITYLSPKGEEQRATVHGWSSPAWSNGERLVSVARDCHDISLSRIIARRRPGHDELSWPIQSQESGDIYYAR
jgi:hypothetical protein